MTCPDCYIKYSSTDSHVTAMLEDTVVLCPLHEAAEEIFKAASAGLYFIPMGQPEYRILEEALAKVDRI